jgi:hypothetical protein
MLIPSSPDARQSKNNKTRNNEKEAKEKNYRLSIINKEKNAIKK